MRKATYLVVEVVLLYLLAQLPGCSGHCTDVQMPGSSTASTSTKKKVVRFVEDEESTGLKMVLSEADSPSETAEQLPVASGKPLSNRKTEKLLSRLPAIQKARTDRKDFSLRKGSEPVPRTGKKIDLPFPPQVSKKLPPKGKAGELDVLRYAPEGDVQLAPHLSITFSQPIVAISSQEEAAQKVPARLFPEAEGKWRWIGARTALFQPRGERFPMATDYVVKVPKGTLAATGNRLKKEVRFQFSTPPVGIVTKYPTTGPQELLPIIFIGFDQQVNTKAILDYLSLKAGRKSYSLRLATKEEIADDRNVRMLVDSSQPERWVAALPKASLPKGTTFTLSLNKGAPSAEGPKKTPGDQAFTFKTHDPLQVVEHYCSRRKECPPTAPWLIRFNNTLDADAFDETAISVKPEIPHLHVRNEGDYLLIDGVKHGRTTYTVTLPADLKDKFGQTLGSAKELEFEVGPAEQTIFGPGKPLVTIDPKGPAELSVFSVNHKQLRLSIHRVDPNLWDSWTNWRRKYRRGHKDTSALPGVKLVNKTIKIKGREDDLTETRIDFKPYLQGGYGQFLLWVEQTEKPKKRRQRQEVLVWVQVTRIGVTAFVDDKELLAWTTELEDGRALGDVEVQLLPTSKQRGKSDGSGLARLELGADRPGDNLVVARRGRDTCILPRESGWWGGPGGWSRVEKKDQLSWYTFDDRGMYRPGEQARIKGWIRKLEPGKKGDIRALNQKRAQIEWKLRGPRGNDLAKGKTDLSRLGGFDIAVTFPKDINLGTAWLQLEAVEAGGLDNETHAHPLEIQEFRRPEFEVATKAEPAPHILGQKTVVSVNADYYAGGGLAGAPVSWTASSMPGHFTPPNRSDFHFGVWSPWWCFTPFFPSSSGKIESFKGTTDAIGAHHLQIHFESINPPRPMNVSVEARVEDVNRQTWSSHSNLLVHPSSLYIGLKTERSFVGKGESIDIDTLVVDIDGNTVPEIEVAVRMARLESKWNNGRLEENELSPADCSLTSTDKAQSCKFSPEMGGVYRVRATILDAEGRRNQTDMRVWVVGGELPPSRNVEQEKLTLVPEKQEYQPGQTARFLVQSPFFPAEGLLTVRRSGLVKTERFTMEGSSHTLEVPIKDAHIPNIHVQVDVVGAAERTDDKGTVNKNLPKRVAYATGSLTFKVPPLKRTLAVTITPRESAVAPGSKITIDLIVKNSDKEPVSGAEVAVVVADESVLSLSNYKLPDPITLFYAARSDGVWNFHSRNQVELSDPESLPTSEGWADKNEGGGLGVRRGKKMSMIRSAPLAAPAHAELALGGSAADEKAESKPIAMRTDFRALALFAPEVKTDARGKATIPLTLPDSLTRYRIMAVAVSGGQHFGSGESSVTARLPLMVRPSPPRFLNFGDRFELPVVLQNQTDDSIPVDVAVRAANISIKEPGKRVTVPANNRVEVRFKAETEMAGTARFQVVAASGQSTDAADFELPVWTPATAEAFATYGEIDDGAMIQPVRTPDKIWPQFGGLEITTSSTQLQALTDAVLYLINYPFDCVEQIASRVLAIAALKDVLTAFKAEELPTPKELLDSVTIDLERLSKLQNRDGGFAFWRRGAKSWPYLSIHVAHALAQARTKGYEVPPGMWDRVEGYLRNIEKRLLHWYSQESKWAIQAYALNVRHQMGVTDVKKALDLLETAGVEKLPIEASGWLLPILHAGDEKREVDSILHHLNNRVAESAAGAHFVTSYSDGAHVLLHSNRRADGIILKSLIEVMPKSDLIPKLVRGLLGHRKKGKWSNTQENAFVLVALDNYFSVYEKTTPNFIARAWLGDRIAYEHAFKGRKTERAHVSIPMSYLKEKRAEQMLTMHKKGPGRLYYRIGLRYAPENLQLKPADHGFSVERIYEAVDNPDDVQRDDNGTWRIRAGARVRIKLTMVTPMRRYHVALIDPLPAGLETINPALAVSETVPVNPSSDNSRGRYWWWIRPWYEHQNMRDERIEAFTSLLWDGVHTYSYVARATTPGEFTSPPARAEEMYHPETFGRSGTEKVVVW
ncbi:MAG: hypothetical protein GY847_15120 [Proteobacteria bacterium]|nr:hypothetical protein [Pseudomonadota bacterium]